MRCDIPGDLSADLQAIVAQPNVRVIAEKISSDEMEALFATSEYYMLLAASLHSMSTLEAMSHGCICILADAWGRNEYLEDGINGIGISGREGRDWSFDAASGLLTEHHHAMIDRDVALVSQATERLERLLQDETLRQTISGNARTYSLSHHSLDRGQRLFAEIIDDVRLRLSRQE